MKLSALLTSAGINICLCALFLALYSVLRKQPFLCSVYFGGRISQKRFDNPDAFRFEMLLPSPAWILKAWSSTEDDIMAAAGLDAVVFLRIFVFSIRIFSIAAVICLFVVLPLNYYGQERHHRRIPRESMDAFTIGNVREESQWLWVHCLALYIISLSACLLLCAEYRKIAKLRLKHYTGDSSSPAQFTVLVRGIPKAPSYSDAVKTFFMNYHASSYLSCQMIYRSGKVHELMDNAEKMYNRLVQAAPSASEKKRVARKIRCSLCGVAQSPLKLYANQLQIAELQPGLDHLEALKDKECPAAFVFFKTRYAAIVASQVLQTYNPMKWVVELAPEPNDVYWANLWLPYKNLWFRHITNIMGTIFFMFLFLIPVTFVQGLSQLDKLQQMFPFLKNILNKRFISQVVTGYLPSVILVMFLYTVPPTMMFFSTVEGCISLSQRKRSACFKVACFQIWNVFFVNVLSGSVIGQLNVISNPKEIPKLLAKAVPRQATFFITYVLSSGWVSLCSELMQGFALLNNIFLRCILRREDSPKWVMSFPYHTEVPKVLVFVLLGFTCSILAPLILPFLMIYFLLGYVVYRNQILNVYRRKYDTGGQYWPIMHNVVIFALVLTQIIALGVFGMKKSTVASGFTFLLLIFTLLFAEFCRQRFHPLFYTHAAQTFMEMDRSDVQQGRMAEIYKHILTAYRQNSGEIDEFKPEMGETNNGLVGGDSLINPTIGEMSISRIQRALTWLSMLMTVQERQAAAKYEAKQACGGEQKRHAGRGGRGAGHADGGRQKKQPATLEELMEEDGS